MLLDTDGHYVIQGFGGRSFGLHPMISIAPDGTFTTITTNVSSIYTPNFEFTQDIVSGDFFVGAKNDNRAALINVQKSGSCWSSPPREPFEERSCAPTPPPPRRTTTVAVRCT